MDTQILNENINKIFEDAEGYIKNEAERQLRQYVIAMLNQKVNYFITEYVKNNLANMIDDVWHKSFDHENVSKLLSAELEGSLIQKIDAHAQNIYVKYLHEEIKKKVKKDIKGFDVVYLDDLVKRLEAA